MNFKNCCYQLIGFISISVSILIIYCSVPKDKFQSKCGGGIKIEPEPKMKQYDHIILASNVESFNETNTHSHFKTKLAQRKVFPADEDWRVALTEITYKQSWYNIRNNTPIRFLDQPGYKLIFPRPYSDEMYIDAGYYPKVKDLILTINYKLQRLSGICKNVPVLYVHPESHSIVLQPGIKVNHNNIESKFIPSFGDEIENLLGLVDKDGVTMSQIITSKPLVKFTNISTNEIATYSAKKSAINAQFLDMKIRGHYPADIKAGFNNLYIYSNIVQQSNVGDAYGEILTTVPNKVSPEGFGGSIIHEPKNLVYRPLQTRIFDTIEIDITDDRGEEIPFKLGNTVVKLEFVRYD